MPTARVLALSVTLVVACESQARVEDAAPAPIDAPADLTCTQLVDQLRARLAVTPRNCDLASDCALVGNATDRFGFPSCNEAIAFGQQCYGDAVNRAAWTADAAAAALAQQWFELCVPRGTNAGVPGWFDCAPGVVSCMDHVCASRPQACWIDAGVY